MLDSLVCPTCHIEVRSTDYFCYNCGRNLKPKPPSTSITRQIIIYLESFFIPPYGIVIGIHYLRQNDIKSKIVGVIAIILTVISLVLVIKLTNDLIKQVNEGVNSQLDQMQGF